MTDPPVPCPILPVSRSVPARRPRAGDAPRARPSARSTSAPTDDYAELARRKARQEAIEAFGPARFTNRELSRLDFGARLLDLAEDERLPLLERVKFMAIFSEMLDEFFQVRVAGLEDQVAARSPTRSADGLRPAEQLGRSAAGSSSWWPARTGSSSTTSCRQLAAAGIRLVGLVVARRRRPPVPGRRLPPRDLPGPHPARRRPVATPSPTSRTSRSTWWSRWGTRSPASGASPG